MTFIAILIAVNLCWAWAYRGGSSGLPIPYSRWFSLAITPALIGAALAAVNDYSALELVALGAGMGIIALAQADGWGRQMDLGDNDKPDNETGWQIRDQFFESKSSFARDLTGLFMRCAQFLPAAIPLGYVDLRLVSIPVALFIGLPAIWVFEHVAIKDTKLAEWTLPWNRTKRVAWVEWLAGVMLSILTAGLILP